MGYGPRLPFDVPNEGEKVSWEGDQKHQDGTLWGTAAGSIVLPKDRPSGGIAPSDLYQWKEE